LLLWCWFWWAALGGVVVVMLAYAYILHAYAQCTGSWCTRMLSVFSKKLKNLRVFMRTKPKNWCNS
jgi:hypothetical protein